MAWQRREGEPDGMRQGVEWVAEWWILLRWRGNGDKDIGAGVEGEGSNERDNGTDR